MNMIKRIVLAIGLAASLLGLAACERPADVASRNISQAADNFEVNRKITFYNGITGQGILVIEGLCSLGNFDSAGELSVTCKVGPNNYKKHFLGLSDNVTFVAEQIDGVAASIYHYKVYFNPSALIPDVDLVQ
jgi:hypothetical protein